MDADAVAEKCMQLEWCNVIACYLEIISPIAVTFSTTACNCRGQPGQARNMPRCSQLFQQLDIARQALFAKKPAR